MPAVDDRLPPIEILRAEKLRRANERNRAASDQSIEAVQARCAQSLANFVREAWHVLEPKTRYIETWHGRAICQHLEAVTDGRITRLLVNVPPGASKSLLVSVFWPAWEMGPMGLRSMRYLSTAFSDTALTRHARLHRDLMRSPWYQRHWPVEFERTSETDFSTVEKGGREAIPFPSLTSGRADRLIIDDPHSVEKAESKSERERTVMRFREGAINRLNDQERSAIVIIMQRLHEGDISGCVLDNNMGYTYVCLPMEYEPERHCATEIGFDDPRTRRGELLCPERWSAETVEQLKNDMSSVAYAGQYQQRPVPRGGGIIPYVGWEFWHKGVALKYGRNENQYPDFEYVLVSADTAYTEKEENDFSACVVLGIWYDYLGNPMIMLIHAWQERLELHDLVNKLIKTCAQFKATKLLVEGKASGKSVISEIRRLMSDSRVSVEEFKTGNESKVARAHAVQPLFGEEEDGRRTKDGIIYVPCVTAETGAVWPRVWAEMVMSAMRHRSKKPA